MATIVKTRSGKFKGIIRSKSLTNSSNKNHVMSKTFSRKGDALTWTKRVERELESMSASAQKHRLKTFSDLIKIKGDTIPGDFRTRFWVEKLGDIKVSDITTRVIKSLLDDYSNSPALRADGVASGTHMNVKSLPRKRSPASVNRMKARISVILKYAVDLEWITENPVRGKIENLAENNKRTRFLSKDEREALLVACKKSSWKKLHLLVVLAITTGARQGELMNLRWCDIDFTERTALLRKTKNGDQRTLTFPTPAIEELLQHREIGNGLIFASEIMPDRPFVFRKPWMKALNDAGIENFRYHDLRHSCASYLAMSGATLLEIGQVLGHRSTETTARYAHLSIAHKADLTERVMNKVLGNG
jgi:integrase